MTRVRLAAADGVGRLTLARPEKKNALDRQAAVELSNGLKRLDADGSVRVILLDADGDDFCAGADLEALAAMLVGATANYWLLGDVYGGSHPTGVAEERYVAAIADLVAARLGG